MSKSAKLMQDQVIFLHTLMSQHCKTNEAGFAEYEQGWDDHRVHEEVNRLAKEKNRDARDYGLVSVKNLRLNLFGRLPVSANNPNANMALEIEELKARVDALEKFIMSLNKGYHPPQGRPRSVPPMPPKMG